MHQTIHIKTLSLSFPHKTCFQDFSATILPSSRIAVIGRNGSGKSSLLKMLFTLLAEEVCVAYVPQIIESFATLSGGERFNAALTEAVSIRPDILLLDEPTNHLDSRQRHSLLRMLRGFPGTVIVVSHDVELLQQVVDTYWHIDNAKISVFSGDYEDYRRELFSKREALAHELSRLNREKKLIHQRLMQEQERAKKSKTRGEKNISQRKWPTVVSASKVNRAVETSGQKKNALRMQKASVLDQLSEHRLPEILTPTFILQASDRVSQTVLCLREAAFGYEDFIALNINVSLKSGEKLAIRGDNGSGKTTLIKAILGDAAVKVSGSWHCPARQDIAYLDQHYATLNPQHSVLATIESEQPNWSHAEIRRHLNDFLFRQNEAVNASVSTLSGGEKARLSLAQIAAKTPRLLILDEVTNNLDLETREHVIQILQQYPGTLCVISHDEDFLLAIGITQTLQLTD